eukprot:gene5287-18533_t
MAFSSSFERLKAKRAASLNMVQSLMTTRNTLSPKGNVGEVGGVLAGRLGPVFLKPYYTTNVAWLPSDQHLAQKVAWLPSDQHLAQKVAWLSSDQHLTGKAAAPFFNCGHAATIIAIPRPSLVKAVSDNTNGWTETPRLRRNRSEYPWVHQKRGQYTGVVKYISPEEKELLPPEKRYQDTISTDACETREEAAEQLDWLFYALGRHSNIRHPLKTDACDEVEALGVRGLLARLFHALGRHSNIRHTLTTDARDEVEALGVRGLLARLFHALGRHSNICHPLTTDARHTVEALGVHGLLARLFHALGRHSNIRHPLTADARDEVEALGVRGLLARWHKFHSAGFDVFKDEESKQWFGAVFDFTIEEWALFPDELRGASRVCTAPCGGARDAAYAVDR